MAKAGARIIIDDVFLSGAASQERTRTHLAGLEVLWVGVRCDPVIAAGREVARGDRVTGMAATLAESCTKASSTTWKSTPATPSSWTAPAPSRCASSDDDPPRRSGPSAGRTRRNGSGGRVAQVTEESQEFSAVRW